MAGASPPTLTGVVEGPVDQTVLECLVAETGAVLGRVLGLNGKDRILKQLKNYNEAARQAPWVVLLDLDQDGECAPRCRGRWLRHPAPLMCFRIIVRAIETWLLADRERLARFLEIGLARVPQRPEALDDPKQVMVQLARQSRLRALREDMVPEPNTARSIGSRYGQRLRDFTQAHWRPEIAAKNSDSLRRCRERLRQLVEGLS